ncbi:MAG: hypothetical protein R2752_20660, partial [Vicinamibacterales bacterium]
FAVRPGAANVPAIARVTAPARALVDAAVPIVATIDTSGLDAAGPIRIEVALEEAGVAVDRQTRDVPAGAARLDVPLTWVPAGTGATAIRVRARVAGAPETASVAADAGIEVTDTPYRVLFFERRPSWTSTFVRRAVEQDRRFEVTSRVGTSRGVSTATGPAPDALADAAALDPYQVIVCGAPDALTAADVRGLAAFARERGGTVVLLLEQADAGLAASLTGVTGWTPWSEPDGIEVRPAAGTAPLRATEVAWPTGRAPGVDPLVTWTRVAADAGSGASAGAGATGGAPARAVAWRAPAGAGAVVTSALFDAWRFRADSTGFDDFWRLTLAEAAARAPAPVEVRLDRTVVAPGDPIAARVRARGVAAPTAAGPGAAAARVTFSASRVDASGAATPVTLWPGDVGAFEGTIRAPDTPGVHRLVVTVGEARGEAAFVVRDDARAAGEDGRDRLAAWATSHGGRVLPAAEVASIGDALAAALPVEVRDTAWHPMRHPAWIVPFAALLGLEWWHRRRRGLA